ncbi:MAG: hypothetical protein KDJ99_08425 [Candidatus Competibacteraceae bacterium]|nr:hypothetical protein [Candidatus Competibacteraceae bacterium]
MIKHIYEILTARKFKHVDPDVGLLKRVGGYWRIESPKKTLGVSVKIYGSDRFGPNKKSLAIYKLRKNNIENIWLETIESVIAETRDDNGNDRFKTDEFVLSEIIFGLQGVSGEEFAFAFNVTSAPNEYGACIHEGRYRHYYTLY